MKRRAPSRRSAKYEPEYEPIEMPRNSPTGFVCAFFATVMGFALIWHIWWMVISGLSAPLRPSWCSPGATMTNTRSRPRKSRASTAPTSRHARHASAPRGRRDVDRDRDSCPPHKRARPEAAASGGPAPKRIVTGYGFWIFLLSDIVMFSCFFATYAVLSGQTAGGPHGADLFNLKNVAIETGCLLLRASPAAWPASRPRCAASSGSRSRWRSPACSGLASWRSNSSEFADLIARGAGPTRSAFLSAFFTLVGCHGLHVSAGMLWLLTMMAQVVAKGFRADILRRILCFALFWHALDIIWVAVFTVVYLLGAAHERRPSSDDQSIVAPGDEDDGQRSRPRVRRLSSSGLGLAILLTATSFFVAGTDLVWQPSIPVALIVLAIAQMGVHLVFFLHITTGADNTNNVLALAFGVLIVILVIGGSLWIMANLNHNMMPMDQIMQMQR